MSATHHSIIRILFLLFLHLLSRTCTAALPQKNSYQETYRLNRFGSGNLRHLPRSNPAKGECKIAFWNILVSHLTDSPRNPYEKYQWTHRGQAVLALIQQDSPDIFGYCEGTLKQIGDLESSLQKNGYELVGYSSATQKSYKEVQEIVKAGEEINYSQFVGFFYKRDRLELRETFCYDLEAGLKNKRILVQGNFLDRVTLREFSVFISHFDHQSLHAMQKSAEKEISLLKQLEAKGTPWFSMGDRNWPFDIRGDDCAHQYIKHNFICESRDLTKRGHFGPFSTYPGYIWLDEHAPPLILGPDNKTSILGRTVDIGFRSKRLTRALCSYTLTGEFNPQDDQLLKEHSIKSYHERNFASDHFYIGGIFGFSPQKKAN